MEVVKKSHMFKTVQIQLQLHNLGNFPLEKNYIV